MLLLRTMLHVTPNQSPLRSMSVMPSSQSTNTAPPNYELILPHPTIVSSTKAGRAETCTSPLFPLLFLPHPHLVHFICTDIIVTVQLRPHSLSLVSCHFFFPIAFTPFNLSHNPSDHTINECDLKLILKPPTDASPVPIHSNPCNSSNSSSSL